MTSRPLRTVLLATALLGAPAVLVGASAAAATTYPGLDWSRLVQLSDVVVHVEVVEVQTRVLASGRLATFYRGRLIEALRGQVAVHGDAPAEVLFALPGGLLGDLGQRVSGIPSFTVGQHLVVFLGAPDGPDGARGVVGHALGSFTVDEEGRLFGDPQLGGHPEVPRRLTSLKAKLAAPVLPVGPRTEGGAPTGVTP